MNKTIMLERIKDYYDFPTDADFAKFLGVKPQVLSNWKSRNTFDAELLYSKCPELSPSWLLCGEEPMVDEEKVIDQHLREDRSPYHLERKLRYLQKEIDILTEAEKIMSSSGNEIKKALKLLNDQIKYINEELKK